MAFKNHVCEEVDAMEYEIEALEVLPEEGLTGGGCWLTCWLTCAITGGQEIQ
jgi:hypothetical protein